MAVAIDMPALSDVHILTCLDATCAGLDRGHRVRNLGNLFGPSTDSQFAPLPYLRQS